MEPEPSVEDADSAGLTNRLLRKAETAIQGRTSRILAVIERCTDEHNYSAVIRTAEALGVQHIWLIDPAAKDAANKGGTNDGANDGDGDGDGEDADEVGGRYKFNPVVTHSLQAPGDPTQPLHL
jgi:hypothetical protein